MPLVDLLGERLPITDDGVVLHQTVLGVHKFLLSSVAPRRACAAQHLDESEVLHLLELVCCQGSRLLVGLIGFGAHHLDSRELLPDGFLQAAASRLHPLCPPSFEGTHSFCGGCFYGEDAIASGGGKPILC